MPSSARRIASQLLILLSLSIACAAIDIVDYVYSPVRARASTDISVELPRGMTLHALAEQLYADGAIDSPLRLRLYARWLGADRHLQAGKYTITPATTPHALLHDIVQGNVVAHKLIIIEGWNAQQLTDALPRQLLRDQSGFAYERLVKLPAVMGPSIEGLLYPDTYFYTPGEHDLMDVIEKAHARLLRQLDAAWEGRDRHIAITDPYAALIVASLIEKETAIARERPLVAAVIYNRLRKSMRLQIDPTVIYALGSNYQGQLHKADLSVDSPYNTYRHKGLPPTPIAFPSASALHAAMHPAHSDALYFVAKGNGEHAFAASLPDHNQNVNVYLVQIKSHAHA